MFGNDDKKAPPKLVGAKEKIEAAQQLAIRNEVIRAKKEGQESGPAASLAIVFGFCVALAAVLSNGVLKTNGIALSVGDFGFDRLLFGPGNASFTGVPGTDALLTILFRAIAIFLVTGIVPGVTRLWQGIFDRARVNLYIAFWGTTVGIVLLFYLLTDTMAPLFSEVMTAINSIIGK